MKLIQFNRKQLLRTICLACMAAALSLGTSAKAQTVVPSSVTAPYSADLTGGGSFTTTGSSYISTGNAAAGDSTSATPSAGGFQQTATSAGFHTVVNGATTTVSNLGGATPSDFIETANMRASSFTGYQDGTLGLIALGNGTTISTYDPAGLGYAAGMTVGAGVLGIPGQLSIRTQSATGGDANVTVTGSSLTFNMSDTYHFELLGIYGAGNDLTLTLTVTDLNNPLNTGSLTSNVGVALAGRNFGTQVNAFASSVEGTVSHFSIVAVPEPSDYALMLLGGAALLGVARRQKKATV